jgi:hypothetical protein
MGSRARPDQSLWDARNGRPNECTELSLAGETCARRGEGARLTIQSVTAALMTEQPRRLCPPDCSYRRNGAVRARCLARLLHRRADRIKAHDRRSRRQPRWPAIGWTSLVLWNAQNRIKAHDRRSRRQPRWPAIGWTSLVLWNAQNRSRRPQRSCSRRLMQASVCERH